MRKECIKNNTPCLKKLLNPYKGGNIAEKSDIVVFENPDKQNHEKRSDDPADFPCPTQICVFGKSNSGKTNIVKNIIARQTPCFERIFVYHVDSLSGEYDCEDGFEYITELPPIEDIEPEEKKLLIFEDINVKMMNKEQRNLLNRYFGYVSTHKNLTLIIVNQKPQDIPTSIRDMCKYFIMSNYNNSMLHANISSRIGIRPYVFNRIIKDTLTDIHDFITIDSSTGEVKLYKNLSTPIDIEYFEKVANITRKK